MSGKTISVSYDELQGVINEMKSTKKKWTGIKETAPTLSGKGVTLGIVNNSVQDFTAVYNSVCTLMDNTISYLENVYKMFDQSEKSITSKKEK